VESETRRAYQEYLNSKAPIVPDTGMRPGAVRECLFPFQRDIVQWALQRGRAALFADTGLGKTISQLEWASQVSGHTQAPVLILAPLAVGQQTAREARKFGIGGVKYCREQTDIDSNTSIVVTNYERLHKFNQAEFRGIVLDESSVLKSFMGKTKRTLVSTFKGMRFKLACTATPAPNDHLELGNHAEFLDVMASNEMIARWFINDTSTFGTYRLKGHAVRSYWDWVSTWARMLGLPSDMGYSDEGFVLPELRMRKHVVEVDITQNRGDKLFRIPELSATSYHKEKRLTADSRSRKIADCVEAEPNERWLIWCETDYEADALTAVIPNAIEVRGSDSTERKELAALWFAGDVCEECSEECAKLVRGKTSAANPELGVCSNCGKTLHPAIMVSKSGIFGLGLNFQKCARVAFVGAGYSYESYYQSIRRCWRFGQTRPVDVHIALASTEREVWDVLMRKAADHERMKSAMFEAMRRAQGVDRKRRVLYNPQQVMRLPEWLFDHGTDDSTEEES